MIFEFQEIHFDCHWFDISIYDIHSVISCNVICIWASEEGVCLKIERVILMYNRGISNYMYIQTKKDIIMNIHNSV